MKILYGINDKFEEELKKLCNKDELTMAEVDAVYKMVDVIKDIATIEAMHNAEMDGYSGAYANTYSREYARGGIDDYANTRAYNSYRDYSGARGRDSMGRYTSRDGMPSGNSQYDKEDMINNLRMKARNARSEEERANYLNMADRLSM